MHPLKYIWLCGTSAMDDLWEQNQPALVMEYICIYKQLYHVNIDGNSKKKKSKYWWGISPSKEKTATSSLNIWDDQLVSRRLLHELFLFDVWLVFVFGTRIWVVFIVRHYGFKILEVNLFSCLKKILSQFKIEKS